MTLVKIAFKEKSSFMLYIKDEIATSPPSTRGILAMTILAWVAPPNSACPFLLGFGGVKHE